MISVISFPNFICLLLTGVLVVHMITREQPEGSFPELADDLEVVFCKLPQSSRTENSRRCTSAKKLFLLLRNRCSPEIKSVLSRGSKGNKTQPEEDKGKQEIMMEELGEDTETELSEAVEDLPEEKMKSSLVDSFVISLLVCSAIVSLLEWHRERSRNSEKIKADSLASPGAEPPGERRISLADLTVNRHIRRKDSQQLETIRQNSCPQSSRPPLLRRSSFPAQIPEGRTRHAPQRQQSIPGVPSASVRRMSIDLTEDDGSPDRRRVRIIRRH